MALNARPEVNDVDFGVTFRLIVGNYVNDFFSDYPSYCLEFVLEKSASEFFARFWVIFVKRVHKNDVAIRHDREDVGLEGHFRVEGVCLDEDIIEVVDRVDAHPGASRQAKTVQGRYFTVVERLKFGCNRR